MKKAVIFDLDGTLLNTIADIANAVNSALWENGLPYRSIDEVRRFVGNGARKLIERCVEDDPSKYDSVMRAFESIYGEDCLNQTRPYTGVMQLLRRLKEEGYALGVLSNKPDFAVGKICRHFFGGMLDFAVGQRTASRSSPTRRCCSKSWTRSAPTRARPSMSETARRTSRAPRRRASRSWEWIGVIDPNINCARRARRRSPAAHKNFTD